MTLSDLSIQRPVLTWVMMSALVVFGLMGYSRLGVDHFPEMDFPIVSVLATLDGASPEGIEEDVTDVLEEQLNSVGGLRELRSTSLPGRAVIIAEFELGTDIDVVVQEVRDKVAAARYRLPPELEPPIVSKNPFRGSGSILWTAFESDRSTVEASEYLHRIVKPALETIPGVASISTFGQRERAIRIWLDGEELRARELASSDVVAAMKREHVERPGGKLESAAMDYTVKTDAEFTSVEGLRHLVVAYVDGGPITLADVAVVEDGMEDLEMIARFRGTRTIGLGVNKQSGANTVAIADEAKRRFVEINKILPADMQLGTGSRPIDMSEGVKEAVKETQFALIFGALLAVITVFVFLRRWRPTLIVAAAIPLSLITSFGFTWLFGFTLNTMTLLAMALAVGVVIDDAIVVLENIERHREAGEEPFHAASIGTREITFAATAATLAIAIVFIPAFFVEGLIGNFLGDFGVTVATSVMASLFVALTLTPMLAARIPAARERKHGSVYHRLERGLSTLEARYRTVLNWTLEHRRATVGLALASLVLTVFFFSRLGTEMFPPSDKGLFIVRLMTPPGSSLEFTEEQLKIAESWWLAQPELAGLFANVGGDSRGFSASNRGMLVGTLIDRSERDRTVGELIRLAREDLSTIPGLDVRMFDLSSMGGGGTGDEFSVEIRGNISLHELNQLSDRLIRRLEAHGGFVDLDKSLKLGLPELRVIPDREKAAALGVDAETVATTVQAMIGGLDVGVFKESGRRYNIRMRLSKEARQNPSSIERLYVRGRDGEVVELRNLVEIRTGAAPSEITRTDRQRSVAINANLDGIALGDAVEVAEAEAAEILPEGVHLDLSGQAEAMRESAQQYVLALGFSILLIYLVLAAQFESFVHPFTVMFALPFAMFGASAGLLIGGMSLNLFSMIGFIMLMGLVTKNSILVVDYANQLRATGLDKVEAMRQAAPVRLRPVLMTAISMIAGVLPAVIGVGPGAETRQPMAVAVACGMFSSTVLTLLIVPVFYVGLDNLAENARHGLGTLIRRIGSRGATAGASRG